MRLFLEAHSHRRGYAVSRIWSDAECSAMPPMTPEEAAPVRWFQSRRRAEAFIARYNRRFATH